MDIFVLEITLAVILTLLGLAILAILLTRWTRRKQNEIDVSRYNSEQSAGLLDYEDGKDFSSQTSETGGGFRHSYSTESDTSYDDREIEKMRDTWGRGMGVAGDRRNGGPSVLTTRSVDLPEPGLPDSDNSPNVSLSVCVAPSVNSLVQFTAPIPGATGPIKLSQKTIVQTPGPIVQYTGSTGGATGQTPGAPDQLLKGNGNILRSGMEGGRNQRGEKKEEEEEDELLMNILESKKEMDRKSNDEMAKAIGPVAAVDSSGKIVLSPVVIFPGYMDGELAKKSVPKALIVKSGTTKSRSSQEENKETLKKEILFRDSHESLTSMHKTGSKSKAKGIELEKGQIGMEVKVKESDTRILKTQEAQVKKSKTGIPQEQEAQVEKSEARISQEQEAHVEETETGIPQGQEAQVERSESGIPQGPEAQAERSESGIQGQKAQVKKSEAGLPQGQEVQVKKENSEDKREQDREKGDAKKNKDTKQNDAKNKKDDEVKDKVKGKKEPEAKGKKVEASKKGKGK
ncbi:testis-expressed basic protein 1 [Rousettus aegyptiacus]|uniref:testis-expressed basic protein 1 n=1 Tax=Rousettus aegyptiacus TaxID=9407 RepID=UPI00168CB0F6|nr:testis-expressed basic protein 1 [Rousettus aegyptiacus]